MNIKAKHNHVNKLIYLLQSHNDNPYKDFEAIFEKAQKFFEKLDVEFKCPYLNFIFFSRQHFVIYEASPRKYEKIRQIIIFIDSRRYTESLRRFFYIILLPKLLHVTRW